MNARKERYNAGREKRARDEDVPERVKLEAWSLETGAGGGAGVKRREERWVVIFLGATDC